MSFTSAQLAARVLERLKVVTPPDTPTAEDATLVSSFYGAKLAEMREEGMAYWDQDDIPDEIWPSLVDYIAGGVASEFGLQRDDLSQAGEMKLRRLAHQGPTFRSVTSEYF